MRLRVVIPILIFAAVLIAFLFWFRPKNHTSGPGFPPVANTQPAGPTVAASTNSNPSSPVPANVPVGVDAMTASNNAVQVRELRIKTLAESKNVPVQFYGIVIDQDSNALSGARVELGVRHTIYATSVESAQYKTMPPEEMQKLLNPTVEVVSDESGRFQWTDPNITGDLVGLGSITKQGYEMEPGQYSGAAGGGNYENPVVFKMWSTNIHETLITGEKESEIVPDGRPYTIDLTKNTFGETGPGDLTVWVQYTNQVTPGQLYAWSATIQVVKGGLLEEPFGTVMYEAPTEGFVPAFQLQQQIKGGQSGEIGDRCFYLILKNGQEYGRININMYAPYGKLHPGLVRFSYAINPSGSRILR